MTFWLIRNNRRFVFVVLSLFLLFSSSSNNNKDPLLFRLSTTTAVVVSASPLSSSSSTSSVTGSSSSASTCSSSSNNVNDDETTCTTDTDNNKDISLSTFEQQTKQIQYGKGFLAALDQSGGSTPKALQLYGILTNEYEEGSESMYDLIHEMRTRIIKSPSFTNESILGAILFENTMDRYVDGIPTAQYLWSVKKIVPFLKIDQGLMPKADGIQILKPIPNLSTLLERAKLDHGIYGTKMRSLIHEAIAIGIQQVVTQQFNLAKQILSYGLIPIIEPEVNIHSKDKIDCERLLKQFLLEQLNTLDENEKVILKLTIPTIANNFYQECIDHPNVIRVVALSGGYTRNEAIAMLKDQNGIIASFSRALTEGLYRSQSDDEFNHILQQSIDGIVQASQT